MVLECLYDRSKIWITESQYFRLEPAFLITYKVFEVDDVKKGQKQL